MPIINNPDLYEQAKDIADKTYSKPSAYKSGFIVKKYKELGGTYTDDKKPKNLKRWYKEDWKDIGGLDYPVYRPTKRVSKQTPLTPSEIKPENLKEQIKLKQKIKEKNLPAFEGRGYVIQPYTKKKAKELGVEVKPSTNPEKKIDVYKKGEKIASIGAIGYSDYPTFLLKDKSLADFRRKLYRIRHKKDSGINGYYARELLW